MTIDYRAANVDTQALLLAKYLPTGRLWSSKFDRGRVMGRLVYGFAGEIGRLFETVEKFVLTEIDPSKTKELLLEWEKSVQIPDKCFGRPDSIAERRLRVVQKLSNFGDIITLEDFDEFVETFALRAQFVPGNEANAGRLGFGAGPYSTQELKEIRHTLAVRVDSDADVFPLEFPVSFSAPSSLLIQCLVRRIAPANVNIQFFFGENLDTPFVVSSTTAVLAAATRGTSAQSATIAATAAFALPEAVRSGTAQGFTAENSVIAAGDVANLEMNLTADTPSISNWLDQSSGGNDVVQVTTARQPTISAVNGNASLLFDGDTNSADSDFLRNAAASFTSPPGTIAIAFTPTSIAAGTKDIINFRDGFTKVFTIRQNGSTLEAVEGLGGSVAVMSVANMLAVGETRWIIARFRNGGDGLSDLLTDEGDTDTVSAAAAIGNGIDNVNVGANANGANAYAGHIHQVLYWNRFVLDTERTNIGALLDSEWATSP